MKAIRKEDGSWVFVEQKTTEVAPQYVAIRMSDVIDLLKEHPDFDYFIDTLADKVYLDNGI